MAQQIVEGFNVIANFATVVGIVVALFVLVNLRRLIVGMRQVVATVAAIAERLEQVLAPKTGIEGFLNMCAQVVESDPDGTCVVADNGEIVLVNKRMEEISGYHRSELIGKQVEILVPDSFRQVHPAHREGFITGPSSRPMRGLKLRHKRGSELTVGINLNHYMDTSGGFTIAKVRTSNGEFRASGEWGK